MLRTLGIVDARYLNESQRQTARRRLQGKSVLEWVVREITDCQQLNGVIVLTDENDANDFVLALTPSDVPVFRTRGKDSLRALAEVLENYPAESCVWIASDWPFLDATLLDKLVVSAEKKECDFASFHGSEGPVNNGYPTGSLPLWFRTHSLFHADRHAKKKSERDCPCRYFLSRSKQFCIISLTPPSAKNEDCLCFRIDGAEDWEKALELFDALEGEDFRFEKIAHFMNQLPFKA